MRINTRPLLIGAAVLLSVSAALLILIVETKPLVWRADVGDKPGIAAARQLIRSSVHSSAVSDKLREIAFTADDLTTIANFALTRKNLTGFASVSIRETRLVLKTSIKLPLGPFLNIKLIADDNDPQAFIRQARLGQVAVPGVIVRAVGWWLMLVTPLGRYGQHIAPLLREVRIGDEHLRISMNWSKEALDQAQAMMTDMASRERMSAYHQRLAAVLAENSGRRYVNLGALLQSLFALAYERSANVQDAVDENQALILVIAAYVNDRDIAPMLADSADLVSLPKHGVLLNRRIDVAQHFIASAALATSGHRALADMIGLAKEVNDTHNGSCFSFIDLAADRAGARFGKEAVKSDNEAHKLQEVLSKSADETVFMPPLRGLPENLNPAAFAEQFGNIESPPFKQLRQQIEERIAACVLYL